MMRHALATLVVLAISGTLPGAEPVVIPLAPSEIDAAAVTTLSHPLVSPRAARLVPASVADAQALGVPADTLVAVLSQEPRLAVAVVVKDGATHYLLCGAGSTDVAAGHGYTALPATSASPALRVQAGGGSPPRWIRWFPATIPQGTWKLPDGHDMKVALCNTAPRLDFTAPNSVRLLLDLDGGGDFDFSARSNENRAASEHFRHAGTAWVASFDAAGKTLTFTPVDDPAAPELAPLAFDRPAPIWSATTFDGKPVRLSDFRGRFVFMDVWATWCGPCVAEMPNIQKASEKFKDSPITFISISIDAELSTASKFIEKKKYTYNQAWAKGEWESEICRKYQISGIPATFLIDPEGKLIGQDLRGKTIEEALAATAKYSEPGGKDYFIRANERSALFARVGAMAESGHKKEALALIDETLKKHPEWSAEDRKGLERYKQYLTE